MTEEELYITKANYFVDLRWFNRAIHNYKKALTESKDPRIHSMLGYCYSQIGNSNDSADYYRTACKKLNDPTITLNLAGSEFETGNIDKSQEILEELKSKKINLDSSDRERVRILEENIEWVKKGRKDLKKYKKA